MLIIGAGLSGLLAATQFQQAEIHETSERSALLGHRALLRFRSSAVADAVGIPFRKVRVHKGIWRDGRFIAKSIRASNQYALKMTGTLGDRSIWNLDEADRFVAPDDFAAQLLDRVGSRVVWGSTIDVSVNKPNDEPIISTMPMPSIVDQLGLKVRPVFQFKSILVSRFRVPQADVFQTVYFPAPDLNVYRASITGETMIVESVGQSFPVHEQGEVLRAFGLDLKDVETGIELSTHHFGKIAPIDDGWRRKFIVEATQRLNVYSLGRFALWRNVLIDDVLRDIAVIKRLLKGDAYATVLKGAGQ